MSDSQHPNDSSLLSIREAAKRLSVSAITVRRMIRNGRLRAIRFSSTLVRIPASDLQKLIGESIA